MPQLTSLCQNRFEVVALPEEESYLPDIENWRIKKLNSPGRDLSWHSEKVDSCDFHAGGNSGVQFISAGNAYALSLCHSVIVKSIMKLKQVENNVDVFALRSMCYKH